jgi:hypothetical protein
VKQLLRKSRQTLQTGFSDLFTYHPAPGTVIELMFTLQHQTHAEQGSALDHVHAGRDRDDHPEI